MAGSFSRMLLRLGTEEAAIALSDSAGGIAGEVAETAVAPPATVEDEVGIDLLGGASIEVRDGEPRRSVERWD